MKRVPKLYYFKNRAAMELYIVRSKAIATKMDVAINKLVRDFEPSLPEIREGQEYDVEEKPYAYFKYKGQVWPIYDDDPGQQSYFYFDGKAFGAGTYTAYPYNVEYFCSVIDTNTNLRKYLEGNGDEKKR